MAGIFDNMGYGSGLIGQEGGFLGNNRNAMIAAGLGLASGNNWSEGATNAFKGFLGGQTADQNQAALRAAIPHIMSREDLDPAVKAAIMQNPNLAVPYLTAMAKPPEYKPFSQEQSFGNFNPQTGRTNVQGSVPKLMDVQPGHRIDAIQPPTPQPAQPSMPGAPSFNNRFVGASTPMATGGPEKPPAGSQWDNPAAGPSGGASLIKGTPQYHEHVNKLTDDFRADPSVKRWHKVAPIMPSIREARDTAGGAADINIIYGMATIMDPDSVVREAEQIMGRKSGGPLESLQALESWVKSGQILTPEVRNRLIDQMESRAKYMQKANDSAMKSYNSRAKILGANPNDIFYLPEMYDGPGIAPPPNPNHSRNFGGEILSVATVDAARKLPSGSKFRDPNGIVRQVP